MLDKLKQKRQKNYTQKLKQKQGKMETIETLDPAVEYQKRQQARIDAQKNSVFNAPEVSEEEVRAKLKAKYEKKYKLKTPEHLTELESQFPLLKISSLKDIALDYLLYDDWHESVGVICHEEGVFYFSKIRQKYEALKNESGAIIGKGERRKGKWIFGDDGQKSYPFPLRLFNKNNSGSIVVVCEGHRDAINLNLLGVAAITTGGTSEEWSAWADLLKDKEVVIWLDNDEAGENATSRYSLQLYAYAARVHKVDWKLLWADAHNKADASDFIKEFKISDSGSLFAKLTPSYLKASRQLNFSQAANILLAKTKPLKAKNYEEVNEALQNYCKLLTPELYQKFEDEAKNLYNKLSEEEKAIIDSDTTEENKYTKAKAEEKLHKSKMMLFIKKFFGRTAMTGLFKHQISDAIKEIIEMMDENDLTLRKKNKKPYFWCGTHYSQIKEWQWEDFMLDWTDAAQINIKQAYNPEEFIVKVQNGSFLRTKNLDAEQEKLAKYGVINHQGGTILIDEYGKIIHKSHDKTDGITYCLPFAYDPNAKGVLWSKFLESSLDEKESRDILQEYVGYLFLPRYVQKFLYLYGLGSNGKSVFLKVIESLFNPEQVSHLEVDEMVGHNLDVFDGKLLNVASEIKTGGFVEQINLLKKIVEGAPIQVNPKHEKSYTNYKPPKQMMSGNDMMKGGGLNDGLIRRLIMIPFDKTITEAEQIDNLENKILETELPAVFNWALEGMQRLIANGYKFTSSQKVKDITEEYKKETNQAYAFVRTYFIHDAKDKPLRNEQNRVNTGKLFDLYKLWAKNEGISANFQLKQNAFSTKIGEYLNIKAKVMRTSDGKSTSRYFLGCKLIEDEAATITEDGKPVLVGLLNESYMYSTSDNTEYMAIVKV